MTSHLIEGRNSVDALCQLLEFLVESGTSVHDKLEHLQCLLAVEAVNDLPLLEELRPVHKRLGGAEAWQRTAQLYETTDALSWKVSYRRRLVGEKEEEDQVERVCQRLSRLPGSNTLTLTFFRPRDHRRAEAMPAGVPCPLTADFKFRDDSLHLTVFFRSQDAFRFGLPDFYYFRRLQEEVLERAREAGVPEKMTNGRVGTLCFLLSRSYVRREDREDARQLWAAGSALNGVRRS